ncbi:hypothetical protein MMC21_006879 [Puttea exsequens]|nr:hypothetical protein [Puttea exsequens]
MIIRTLIRNARIALPIQNHTVPLTRPLTVPSFRPSTQTSSLFPRTYATKSPTDSKIEEIQELYATARDEFEIAQEETEKKTVYATDDRAVAHEELEKLKEAYQVAVGEEGGAEIERRVGQRIRELARAVEAMDEMAKED